MSLYTRLPEATGKSLSSDAAPVSRAPSSYLRDSQKIAIQPAPAASPATAFWFDTAERPLFGWYHPSLGRARATAILCNPIGHEALVMHRTYRRLAHHLAAKGVAVVRFDYDGTGDSAGNDHDPSRVERWLASIQSVIEEATRLTGCQNVVLIGARVGALLAATQAARSSVSGLVLIATPRSGKAWMREARALQAIKDSLMPRVVGIEPDQGIAGFLLDEATRAELSALNISQLSKAPARNALVIARDDLPGGEPELIAQLTSLGVSTRLCVAPGYAASNPQDPFKAVVPVQLFGAISDWFEATYPLNQAGADPDTQLPSQLSLSNSALLGAGAREQVVDVHGLFGILSEPANPNEHSKTAVVLLNIGANHHVGSNRMYVRMARDWAAEGFQVLRMDFSGMGDSRLGHVGKENDVYAARFMAEARSAVDFLTDRGASNVVLMGLCSGAYVAYHTAIADPRVSGVVLINPLTFHWTEGDSLEVRMRESFGSTNQYKRRLLELDTWRRMLKGEVGVAAITAELARRVGRRATYEMRSIFAKLTGGIAEATDIERGFRRLAARGTSSLLVLGAEDGSRDVIAEHLGKDAASVRAVKGFTIEIWSGADHTFTPLWAQRKLTKLVRDHLLRQFGSG